MLHIGTMKSGTTFLQSVLAANADLLEHAGVDVISGRFTDDRGRPHQAAQELHETRPVVGEWSRIVDAVDRSPCETVVVSSEFFSFLRPPGVEAAVSGLSGHELTVVLAARDQIGAIPAQWQSYTRNRGRLPFAGYVREIAGDDRADRYVSASFHQAQDVPDIADRWARPGVDRLALVLVPPPGSPPDTMWWRFVEAAGLPPVEVALDEVTDNRSLGYAACDYLRRLNPRLADLSQPAYRRLVRPLAHDVLAPLSEGQGRPALDRATAGFALERNRQIRSLLERSEIAHVGQAADLPIEVDLEAFPDEVEPPDRAQVRECADAVLAYAARRAGVEVPAPDGLPATVIEAARLLSGPPAG